MGENEILIMSLANLLIKNNQKTKRKCMTCRFYAGDECTFPVPMWVGRLSRKIYKFSSADKCQCYVKAESPDGGNQNG